MRAARWIWASALVLPLLVPGLARGTSAVRSSDPVEGAHLRQPPQAVSIVLRAPVEKAFLRLVVEESGKGRVSGPAHREVDDQSVIIAPIRGAGEGRLSVTWRALSQDGHVVGGAYGLSVGPARAPPLGRPASPVRSDQGPLLVLGRLLVIVGILGLAGLAFLRYAVVAPAARASERRDGASRWWRRWWTFAAVAALGLALSPAALLFALRSHPSELGNLLGHTRWGRAWIAEALLTAVALAAALVLRRRKRGHSADSAWLVPCVAVALAAAAISWAGHAASGSEASIQIALDAVHMLATAAWLGGLVGLLAVLPLVRGKGGSEGDLRFAAALVVRFSALAIVCVGLLVVTGVFRGLAELSSFADLTGTSYGQVLLAKLGLFGLLLLGGAYNRLLLHPRLERAALGLAPDDRGARARLRTSVAAELALAGALIVSVALLVSLTPPG